MCLVLPRQCWSGPPRGPVPTYLPSSSSSASRCFWRKGKKRKVRAKHVCRIRTNCSRRKQTPTRYSRAPDLVLGAELLDPLPVQLALLQARAAGGHTAMDTRTRTPPPPQNTHTHTEPRRRVAALPGPCRAVSVPEGRAVGSLPARLQDAGGGGGVALLQHRGVNVAQLGVGCGRARGRLPTPPLARGTALLPRAARSVP